MRHPPPELVKGAIERPLCYSRIVVNTFVTLISVRTELLPKPALQHSWPRNYNNELEISRGVKAKRKVALVWREWSFSENESAKSAKSAIGKWSLAGNRRKAKSNFVIDPPLADAIWHIFFAKTWLLATVGGTLFVAHHRATWLSRKRNSSVTMTGGPYACPRSPGPRPLARCPSSRGTTILHSSSPRSWGSNIASQ